MAKPITAVALDDIECRSRWEYISATEVAALVARIRQMEESALTIVKFSRVIPAGGYESTVYQALNRLSRGGEDA